MSIGKRKYYYGASLVVFTFVSGLLGLLPVMAEKKVPSLSAVVDSADVIVVGTVKASPSDELEIIKKSIPPDKYSSATVPKHLTYSIAVQNVLKGCSALKAQPVKVHSLETTSVTDYQGTKQVSLTGYSTPAGYESPGVKTYGLFLLKNGANGIYDFVDDAHPVFEITKFEDHGIADSGLTEVVKQLTEFLDNPADNNHSPVSTPGWAVGYGHGYREAAWALKGAPYEMVSARLHEIARSNKVTTLQSLLAIDCLFAQGDFADKDRAKELLLRPLTTPDDCVNTCGNWSPIVDDSAYVGQLPAIRDWLLTNPEVVRSIGDGLRSPGLGVRRQAACVLSELGTMDMVAPLSKLGLNDQDRTVLFFSCQGIAKAIGVPMVYNGNFQTGQAHYVNFFKKLTSYVDLSGSPLTVPKLEDPRPAGQFTQALGLSIFTCDLPDSPQQADLIVAGHLTPILPVDPSKKLARVCVDRVLKNAGRKNLDNIIVTTYYGATFDRGLYFLKQQRDGTYRYPYGAYLDALPTAPSDNRSKASSLDINGLIAEEMIAVLSSPQRKLAAAHRIETSAFGSVAAIAFSSAGAFRRMPAVIKPSRRKPDCTDQDFVYGKAACALKELPKDKVLPGLKAALNLPQLEEQSRIWITSVLFSLGDYDALNGQKTILLSDTPLSEGSDCALGALCETVSRVCYDSMVNGKPSDGQMIDRAVNLMSELMNSKRVRVRRAAALALGCLRGSETSKKTVISVLTTIGLYDPDMDVRYNSIQGLEGPSSSVVAEQCSYKDFQMNQAKYVERMRRWAHLDPLERGGGASEELNMLDFTKPNYAIPSEASSVFEMAICVLGLNCLSLGALGRRLNLKLFGLHLEPSKLIKVGFGAVFIGLGLAIFNWLYVIARDANLFS